MPRERDPDEPRIYLLPNLMTAGNLACGFFAVLTIFNGILVATTQSGYVFEAAQPYYEKAILLIFASCIFDLLDGRLARFGGQESPFGREFDSLADVISFGMAPSMLMAKAVVFELEGDIGWWLACIYVLCGAIRLARFNCIAAMPPRPGRTSDFTGLPIPMAAGFISSLTYLVIYFNETDRNLGAWKYVLGGAMLGLSLLMVSKVKYPSFKKVGWRTRGTPLLIVAAAFVLIITVRHHHIMPAVLFSSYLLYGLVVRPFLPVRVQRELEAENADADGDDDAGSGPA
ncbi:MAG: CDP-diacylglycerol--serine O-phosphatidyltransferase [Verrucomicrobia bacterium]|nr:MAG: CDP-diacylglycerol--serine O-phosphatidyltransferase [Verrucomicrobiota bacterium]TAE88938.1 MAG: CDP-diacylglycerol--serine O-phosphatidyltransferase [Verrucomicrobiota bacterium]TAF27354.1 MAG: CDP-diacylglycerol--serine O-phosphatidyltransferase [Verrucomicrobiota bacterium]TAF42355.1 MAG: CDP-diacylglycerol--serine O-phosphatidyltransferase [Verrucomicrobiota bacterium]